MYLKNLKNLVTKFHLYLNSSTKAMKKNRNLLLKTFNQKLQILEAKITDRQAEITKLESLIESKDKKIARTELEKQQLEMEIEQLRAAQDINKRSSQDIIKTFERISPKKAAPIFSKMSDDEALKTEPILKRTSLQQY